METATELNTVPSAQCDCCVVSEDGTDSGGEPYGCHERKTVFTGREERVLERIRENSRQAKAVRERIAALKGDGAEVMADKERAGEELDRLRKVRLELEEERLAAADERMRLLGHL